MKLLYIAGGTYPNGSAYSTRVKGFIGLFNSLGFNVHVLADYYVADDKTDSKNETTIKNTFQTVGKKVSLIQRTIIPHKCKKVLIKYLDENTVNLVIIKSLSDRFQMLFRVLEKRGIPVVLESCEWYHYSNWRGGILNPWFLQFYFSWKYGLNKVNGVIVISRLLEEHFLKKNENILRIPTIMDASLLPFNIATYNDRIILMYAGNPGKSKEMFYPILKALYLMGKDAEKILFNIYGVSEKSIRKNIGKNSYLLDSLGSIISIHGKVSQSQIHAEYARSDFSIFLRPDRRSSNAGFPTKLAESMLAGTPVICNSTGDIRMYVKEYNGILLKSTTPNELKDVFLKLLRLSRSERQRLRINARNTADNYFKYKKYINDVKAFLKKFI